MPTFLKHGFSMLFGGLLMAAILVATQVSAQDEPGPIDLTTQEAPTASEAAPAVAPAQVEATNEEAAPIAPVLSYQGQLLDPFTNQPKPNGAYAMTFAIYNAGAGGTPLWQEAKTIAVNGGYFATLLGDVIPLNLGIFNGQTLFLGVRVGLDPEATPRQRLAYAPYALYAGNADTLDGLDSSAFVRVGQGSGISPLAYGLVDDNGSRINGSNNWSAAFVDNGGNQRGYEVTISGEDFNFRNYVILVTPNCGNLQGESRMVNTGSTNGRMLVEFLDPAGNREQCRFNFVVYKP
ncbi:MAG TPA: hypothetical protein PKE45_12810 [Caldilineaceae bacterium]|nr:hypothetical protein [Caldilineaceae bacterium]